MGISIPSAEEYEANRGDAPVYTLFPPDDYIVEIKDIEIQKDQPDIFRKNDDGTIPIRDTLLVRLRPVSFLNGDDLEDENGDPVGDDRLFFAYIDPTHVGLVPQPAKARKFFASALGVSVEERIDIDDYNDLVGKRLAATVIQKPDKNGKKVNRVTDFRLIRKRSARTKSSDAEVANRAASRLSDADAAKVTKAADEIFHDKSSESFDDDLPF